MTGPARIALAAALALCALVAWRLADRRAVQAAGGGQAAPPAALSPPAPEERGAAPHGASAGAGAGGAGSGAEPSEAAVAERTALLRRFLERLAALRGGDDAAGDELRAVAERLCAEHGRCDVPDVARYYLALTPAERAAGLADEARFEEQWRRVRSLSHDGAREERWSAERDAIERALGDLAAAGLARADFVPAARALALRARLSVERATTDAGLVPAARAALLADAAVDARRALAVFERAGMVTPRLEPLWLLGRAARLRGDLAGARAWLRRCLDASRAVGRPEFEERALVELVAIARGQGDVRAMDRLLAHLATLRSPAESWPLAREHGARLLHEDRPEAALEFLLRHAPREPAYRIDWHLLVGSAFLRAGDPVAARRQFDAMGVDPTGEQALLARASVDLRQGHAQEVVDALEQPGLLGLLTLRSRAEALVLLGEALLALDDAEGAVEPLEAAVELALSRADGALLADAGGGSVVGEWLGLHAVVLLATAHGRLGDPLEAARTVEDHQARSLRTARPDERTAAAPRLSAADLRRWAGAYELGLLTWVVGADSGLVAHVAADGAARTAELPLGRKALERAVRRVRQAILAGQEERAHALARELLATALPSAVRAHVAAHAPPRADGDAAADGTAAPRVLLLLHGPLEALPVEFVAARELLGVDAAPLVLPGLPAVADDDRAAWTPPLEPWTLLGDPRVDGRPRLPGAQGELEALAVLHPDARVVAGAALDRQSVEAALAGTGPVHLATHLVPDCGSAAARLAGAGLELSAGACLSATDVERLRPRLPLVVLAACETGGGDFVDAEGLLGLARAFLEGGTENLLVTSWPVADAAAQRASILFHVALARGLAPSRAARAARVQLAAEGWGAAEWAAVRLVGRH